jgi:hypothetical protein
MVSVVKTYVFEAIDDDGEVRNYVAQIMRGEGNRLILRYNGLEASLEISRICTWCAVDDDDDIPVELRNSDALNLTRIP